MRTGALDKNRKKRYENSCSWKKTDTNDMRTGTPEKPREKKKDMRTGSPGIKQKKNDMTTGTP